MTQNYNSTHLKLDDMLELIVESVYMYLIVLVLALLEIQIEGQYPWAEKLPTWRKKN